MDPSALPFSCSTSDPTFNKCVNNDGSYECQCIVGYSDNNGVCEDDDECADASACQDNADCTNLAGTFECTCAAGYQDSADLTECIDVNECIGRYHKFENKKIDKLLSVLPGKRRLPLRREYLVYKRRAGLYMHLSSRLRLRCKRT